MKPAAHECLFFGLSGGWLGVSLSPRRDHFMSCPNHPLVRGFTRLHTTFQSAPEKFFPSVGGCSLRFNGDTERIKQLDHMCGQGRIIGIQIHNWYGFGQGICLRQVFLEQIQRGRIHRVAQVQRGLIDLEFGEVQCCEMPGGYECRFVRPPQGRRFLGVQGNSNRNDGSKERGQGTSPLNDDRAAQEGPGSDKKDTRKEGYDEDGQECSRPWCRLDIHVSDDARTRSRSLHSTSPLFEMCDRNVTETEGASA